MSFGGGGFGGFGQQNQNQNPGGFGGFGTANNNAAPGTSAFGNNTTGFGANNNPTGGGLFGQQTGGGFGNTGGAFGAANTGFGAKPAFGAATTTSGGGLFGASTTATTGNTGFGGGFGTANTTSSPFGGGGATSMFGGGANKPAGFGVTPAANTTAGGGLFGGGGNTGGAFGNTGFNATNNPGIGTNIGEAPGTNQVAFVATIEKEANNTQQQAFQNILFQEPYKKFSSEELRMTDYNQGRRFGNANGAGAFGVNSGFGNPTGFGNNNAQTTGFGTANTGGTGLFGNNQPAATGGFGQQNNNTGGFGTGGGGLFGQAKPAATGGLFGSTTPAQPAQTGGLFGGGTTGGFGAANNNTAGGFGAANNTAGGGLFGNTNAQKPAGTGFGAFGNTGAATGNAFGTAPSSGFGAAANTNTGATGGGLFGNTAQNNTAGGGLFGNNAQQPAQTTGFGGGGFGAQTQQPAGGGLFGNQQKPATGGLFGNANAQQPQLNTGGGLFGNNNTSTGFGQQNNQQQTGGLFGAKPAATGGGLFGNSTAAQPNQTGGGLFGGLGSNNQTQQQQPQGGGLFGGLNNQNQQKPGGLFGAPAQNTGGGIFGSQQPQQQGGLFGNSTAQQPQQNVLGSSLFNTSQNTQSAPGSLTASINDVSAYGTPSLFANLGGGEVHNPGPLATPLSGKSRVRKTPILPMWKLNPGSATKFVTPSKRGYGFSYSTSSTPSSVSSTPGGFGQSLLGGGSMRGSLSKSISTTSLRKSFNAEDSILAPGSFSASAGPRSYSNMGIKKLSIDRNMRTDLFSSPLKEKQPQVLDSPSGPRKLPKRVSFDPSTVDTPEAGTPSGTANERSTPPTPQERDQRQANGNGVNGNGHRSRDANASPEMEQVQGKELAIVHEEGSPPPAAKASQSSPDTAPGEYWMSPSKDEILAMNRNQRSRVSGFTVGRENVGQVQFMAVVDLNAIPLDEIYGNIVNLETRQATVYPNPAKKPPVGHGLNVPSEITLEQSWPRAKDRKTPLKGGGRHYNRHVNKLKTIANTTFIDYNADTGVWKFRVEHFTTYGLDYDEEDTDGETVGEKMKSGEEPPAQPLPSSNDVSPDTDPDDTFDFRRKRRALPGAFDYSGGVSEDEEDSQQSFLSERSADSASNEVMQDEDDIMDEEHEVPEDQDASPYLGYHQAAEQEFDSPYLGSVAEYQETPGGILRARMRAIKNSNSPLKLQVADGDDWMDMLQKTISPQKRDRATLRTINEVEAYEALKESTRQEASPAKARAVSDSRGFATSIDLMNSLFEKAKSPVKLAAPAAIPTKGFKWPYKRQNKNTDEDEAGMDPSDKAFHDSLRPSWGPDGTLVLGTTPKVLTRSSRRTVEKEGIMSMSRLNIVSESRDVRFAKFSNESSAKALSTHMSMAKFSLVNGVPTVSLGTVRSMTSFFHEQDLQYPANVHEKVVWQLANILFDDLPGLAGTRPSASDIRRLRRKLLSDFWKGLVEDAAARGVGLARSPEDKAIASLSGHLVHDACKHLLDGKNFRLATLVSMIGTSDQAKKDMREQVKGWQEANVLSEFSEPIRAIYELLGGNVCTCEGKKGAMEDRIASFIISQRFGMDWKQAFGLRLWYAIASNDDVATAIRAFEDDIEQDKESRPQPWHAEQGIPALWEDPDRDVREDLLWGLLRLFADKGVDLEDVLRPENSQLSPLDYRLSWQLGRALVGTGKVSYGDDADEKSDAATLSFASQLTNEGSWLEAVFVLLHLSNPIARVQSIQEHLSRHAGLIGNEQSDDFVTLIQTFKIPVTWIWQAKALYMRSVKKDPRQEVIYLLRAASYAEAHKTFVKQVAPVAILERDYDGLADILLQFQPAEGSISDWNFGGQIYKNFVELMHHVKHGSAVSPAVVENLISGLPAVHESARSADIIEVAAISDMANTVAKVVVELAKRGDMQLSRVLGLPLTEDGYLKYSNELAFAYYRDVMVGRA